MSTYSTLRGKAAQTVIRKRTAESLAPEILSMIFLEVIGLHEPHPTDPIVILPTSSDSTPSVNEVATKPLLALSHVCSYWRDIALGNPALWRRTHGRCHDRMQVFLERSRPLTVSLFLDVLHWDDSEDGPMPAPMESVVLRHAARLCRLDLSAVPARQNIPLLLAPLRATHLEVLTITSPCMYHSSLAGVAMNRHPLFNGETSSLKALAIMPIVNWIPSNTPFLQLTHVFISFDADPGLGHPFHVLELLSNTPVIQFFHVDHLVFDASYSGSWHSLTDSVSLTRLHSLAFTTCSYKLVHAIISHLLLPEDVFIRIQGGDNLLEAQGYPAPLPPLGLRPVTSLDVSTEHEQFRMVADGPTSGFWWDGRYDVTDAPNPAAWERWLRHLHESITLSHVTHLHIHLAPLSVFLPELLEHLPQVSHLSVLFGESAKPFSEAESNHSDPEDASTGALPIMRLCYALSPDSRPLATAAGTTATATHVPCPALRTLFIEWQEEVTFQVAVMAAEIPAMLIERARAGFPIRRVVLQAIPHPLFAEWGDRTALDIFRSFPSKFQLDETEYAVVEREEGVEGICAFKMRDVWNIEGEEKYWTVDEYEKPGYGLRYRWR